MRKIDIHSHIVDNGMPLPDMMEDMKGGFDRSGFDAVCFAVDASAGFENIAKNLLSFMYKLMYPKNTYIFASLDYHIPGTCFGTYGFGRQAEMFRMIGVDGFKMYEGKPNARKACGNIPLDGEKYKPFFEDLEKNNIPVAIHLADPPDFWDINCLESYPFEKGWFFGDLAHSTWQEIYDEVFTVVSAYPKLKVIVPQFGYLMPDLQKLAELLDRYPNLYFDTGPATGFNEVLTEQKEAARAFFEKYAGRILFACTGVCEDFSKAHLKAERLYGSLDGLGLSESVAKALYAEGFMSRCPYKELNKKSLLDYCGCVEERLKKCPFAPSRDPVINRALQTIAAIRELC